VDEIQTEFGLTFEHEGRNLVYDVYGEGDDVIVYSHGLLLSSELHRGFAARLAARGHRVVLVDLLGHGRSDKPTHAAEYRIDSYAEQVLALMDHLELESATLGGLSLGANVSLFAATRAPKRVRALVIEMPVMEWAVPAAALIFTPLLLAAHYGQPVLRLASAVLSRAPRTGFGPLDAVLDSGSTPPEVMAAVLHGILVGPVAPTVDDRRKITAPTLIVGHRNDVIHPLDDAENLVEQIPNARIIEARTALEYRFLPGRLADAVSEFMVANDAAKRKPRRVS
jgi:pimeloyl-ACP methyl ester carboxylesterase